MWVEEGETWTNDPDETLVGAVRHDAVWVGHLLGRLEVEPDAAR